MEYSDVSARRSKYLSWMFLFIISILGAVGCYLFYLNRETPVPVSWTAAGGVRNCSADWLNVIQQSPVAPIVANIVGVLIPTDGCVTRLVGC